MRTRMKRIFVLGAAMFCVWCCSAFSVSAENETPIDSYYRQAEQLFAQGEIDDAIENYKKVLFVDQFHYDASWRLVECYAYARAFKKAEKECYYFMSMVKRGKDLSQEEKDALLKKAQIKAGEYRAMYVPQRNRTPYTGKLAKYEVAAVLYAGMMCVLLFIKGIRGLVTFLLHVMRVRKERTVWIDRYWERQSAQFVLTPGERVVQLVFYVILLGVVVYAMHIFKNYGKTECFLSVANAFHALF